MKAMIFAAGLGSRLRPLTNDKPKALVEIRGTPLLEIAIRRLKFFGYKDILVNIHHFGQQVIDFLEERSHFGVNITISDEREQLLDTGGGLKKAAWFFDDGPFLLYNVDILSDIGLEALARAHRENDALATLACRQRDSSRHLLFNREGLLSGWRHNRTGEERICRPGSFHHALAFSGIHVLSPRIFQWMPERDVFSIIDVYLEAGGAEPIRAFRHDDSLWLDVGKPPALERAAVLVQKIPLA